MSEVYDAEIHAVMEGLTALSRSHLSPGEVFICIDNQAAIHTLESNAELHQAAQISQNLHHVLVHKGWSIHTLWTPAHQGIPGNEEADRLAKLGASLPDPCPRATTTKTWLLAQTRALFLREWKTQFPESQPSFTFPTHLRDLPFRHTQALFCIRSNRTPSDPYPSEQPIDCHCGTGPSTTHHFLTTCPLLAHKRAKHLPAGFKLHLTLHLASLTHGLLNFAKDSGLGFSTTLRWDNQPPPASNSPSPPTSSRGPSPSPTEPSTHPPATQTSRPL